MLKENDYCNPYGTWEVTTEGDCEGRSTRNLGVFVGYIDDIAFALAEKCCYSLKFTRVSTSIPTPTKALGSVNVTLNIDSGTWKLTPDQRVEFFKRLFKGRDVHITRGTSYASATLNKSDSDVEKSKREIALSKLTKEERKLLGLDSE